MIELYFIRHGESELNAQGKVAGATETPLTAKGRAQAKHAGKDMKDLGIDYIIASPLIRALDTAKIIAGEINYPEENIEVNPLFIERNFGAMEGQPYTPDFNYDGIVDAESTDNFLTRAEAAVRYLESLPYQKILVVAHGATGRALRHHVNPGQPFHMPLRYKNATLVRFM